MRSLRLLLIVSVCASSCHKGPAAPDLIGPPSGLTIWNVSYKTATVATCPATTPASGVATMTADPSGSPLTLTDQGSSLSGTGPSTIVFTRDTAGKYSWTDPTGRATIAFTFTSLTHAEGESKRLAIPSDPCSATWPFLLDR